MQAAKPLQLKAKELETIKAILKKHTPNFDVYAFGSRVRGNARPLSDIDLVVKTDKAMDVLLWADLKEAFIESDLPFKVDVVDWARTQPHFKRIIQSEWVLVHKA